MKAEQLVKICKATLDEVSTGKATKLHKFIPLFCLSMMNTSLN